MPNALTIDVEDYFQVSAFESTAPRAAWERYESRVERNTLRILELLAGCGVRATFFILGWVAEHFPRLVRTIADAGHEIGSHSYWHRLVYDLPPDEFRADLVRSRDVLEQILGAPVTAYRAPSFSITARSTWAWEILAEEGFRYDSSVFPIHHDRYGMPQAPRFPHVIPCAAGRLWEFPATAHRMAGVNVPVGGGGYFRLYPFTLTTTLLERFQRRWGRPFLVYLHPWEFDPRQPVMPGISRKARFRHYVNLHSVETKFTQLLRRFPFTTLSEALQGQPCT